MIKVVYEAPAYMPYLLAILPAVSMGVVISYVFNSHTAQLFYGVLACVMTFVVFVFVFNIINGAKIAMYKDLIRHNSIPYYTYGKYSANYATALAEYNGNVNSGQPIVFYDVKDGEEEWNEIREIRNTEFKIIVYVQHLKEGWRDIDIDKKERSIATPSYVDPRNDV